MADLPLVFLDTETTGLHRDRRPWEIAIIRRHGDAQTRLLLCVDIDDLDLASAEPQGLAISGFHRRHPQTRARPPRFPRVCSAAETTALIDEWTAEATVVGVIPQFDTECLAAMFAREHAVPRWHPEPVDLVALAVAAVRETGCEPERDFGDLSRQCGVKPPSALERHTALGDARWAMRWYDALTTTTSAE